MTKLFYRFSLKYKQKIYVASLRQKFSSIHSIKISGTEKRFEVTLKIAIKFEHANFQKCGILFLLKLHILNSIILLNLKLKLIKIF